MARLPRIILPNTPHHITQRGNRRQQTFFCNEDYLVYLANLDQLSERHHVDVLAYCLMPNHIHLILVPPSKEAMVHLVSNLHERYSRYVNFRKEWSGHLWQGRYYSVPLSDQHLEKCISYVESNPLRSNLVDEIDEYQWVSRNYRQAGHVGNFLDYSDLRKATKTGRPFGSDGFLKHIKNKTGIDPFVKRSGPASSKSKN